MKNKSVFTAIVLITIGVLCLLQLFEVVNFSWWAVLRLWPLLLIWIGLKCLPIKEPWKLTLKVFTLLFGIFLLFYYSHHSFFHCSKTRCFPSKFKCKNNHVIKHSEIETQESRVFYINEKDSIYGITKLNLKASAGKLTFTPGNSLFSIENNETSQYFTSIVDKTSNDGKNIINATITPIKNFPNNRTLHYDILLSEAPVWEMELELNATANQIDLSVFKVKELQIESNASSVDVKLGNLYPDIDVSIESAASSVKISIPKNMRCFINRDNVLSSMKVKGLKKQSDGSYLSEHGTKTVGTIRISVEANVSSVEIRGY